MRELDVRLDRIVRDLVEEVGPPVPLGARRLPTAYVHDLYRHLAACDLAVVQGGLTTAQGLSPAELTARTGHSDQDTTLNVYSHVIAPEEATQSAVEGALRGRSVVAFSG